MIMVGKSVVPGTTSTGITYRVWTDVIGEEEVTYVSTHEGGLPTTPPALQHGAFIIN